MGPGSSGRARHVEQDLDREIPSSPQALDVERLAGRTAGQRLDPGLDGGVDVDVVALGLTPAALQAHPEPRQRPPHGQAVGHGHRVTVADGRVALDHRAPVGPVAVPVHVPLRVGQASATGLGVGLQRSRCAAGHDDPNRCRPDGHGPCVSARPLRAVPHRRVHASVRTGAGAAGPPDPRLPPGC